MEDAEENMPEEDIEEEIEEEETEENADEEEPKKKEEKEVPTAEAKEPSTLEDIALILSIPEDAFIGKYEEDVEAWYDFCKLTYKSRYLNLIRDLSKLDWYEERHGKISFMDSAKKVFQFVQNFNKNKENDEELIKLMGQLSEIAERSNALEKQASIYETKIADLINLLMARNTIMQYYIENLWAEIEEEDEEKEMLTDALGTIQNASDENILPALKKVKEAIKISKEQVEIKPRE